MRAGHRASSELDFKSHFTLAGPTETEQRSCRYVECSRYERRTSATRASWPKIRSRSACGPVHTSRGAQALSREEHSATDDARSAPERNCSGPMRLHLVAL